MAKLRRITNKIFGKNATAIGDNPDIGQFGSALAGTYIGTTDVETIQALPAWEQGWIGAVTPTQQFPALPERTGVDKVLSYQTGYLMQEGIAEWDENTVYYKGSLVKKYDDDNGLQLYVSIADNNQGNALDSSEHWELASLGGGGLPIGSIFSVACTPDYVPNGSLPCDGTEYTKAQFGGLWNNYLNSSTPLLKTCSYSEYENAINTYGQCPMFAIDTVANTFKTPTIKDGAYITQALSDNELGKSYNESLPNINGKFYAYNDGANLTEGAFSQEDYALGNVLYTTHQQLKKFTFNASDSSSIYQNNAKVQGDNVRLRYFVQVANGQINQSDMDWSQWASDLQGKLNKDHSNDIYPYVINTYKNGTSGYRIWSDGYCEQWGYFDSAGAQYALKTISFLKEFKDINYQVHTTVYNEDYTGGIGAYYFGIHNKTSTSFQTYFDSNIQRKMWKVSGYLKEGEY